MPRKNVPRGSVPATIPASEDSRRKLRAHGLLHEARVPRWRSIHWALCVIQTIVGTGVKPSMATQFSEERIPLLERCHFAFYTGAGSSLGMLKRPTSVLTRSFRRTSGNRFVLVSSAMPWRLAQNSSESTSGFELRPSNSANSWENANLNSEGVAASPNGTHRLSENIASYNAGKEAANSRYAFATASTALPRLTRFRAFSIARPSS